MLGSFSRFGLWRQMALAVGLLIGMQLAWTWGGSVAIWTEGGLACGLSGPVLGLRWPHSGCFGMAQQPRRRRSVAA
jgi:lipopolysaccharide export system permease protein